VLTLPYDGPLTTTRNNSIPEIINTVKRNFYVDNCLKSTENEQVAINTAEQLRLLSKGGFRLTKWLSNSRKVIKSVPELERSKSFKEVIHFADLPTKRALSVLWNVEADTFGYSISLKDKPLTRRGILSVVSSVYDPLGFAAPFILLAK
jgi:hypothetical protein